MRSEREAEVGTSRCHLEVICSSLRMEVGRLWVGGSAWDKVGKDPVVLTRGGCVWKWSENWVESV